ncbi:lysine 2,3-aminomutase YodO family protein [Desulfurobacterium thermolithotrophum DSM 11699]|uniref:Lysine 2,3-aminomutase YodO family protein n=1 Tax=Desulfurobacterium thermolithotrophum (strain DSM 11699 / BSA) TaxID=868864 RepID=F0S2W7_DESTD|nr:KamA family radical SAM protein [Desulfurobacterium thermolithotrophum]ADY73189.1 lysine 2,3-aminomutase YodO family protein [Desulfurobacterium thermolithotrophum DSM 11699]
MKEWLKELQNLVRNIESIEKFFPLTDEEKESFKKVTSIYPFLSTPYYLSLAVKSCAIKRMIFPNIMEISEAIQSKGEEDPLSEERDKKTLHLTHRYPDRVLVVTTNFCPTLCRFCMRKRNWKKKTFFISDTEIENALNYIRKNENIRDVLISGGDPLFLPIERLKKLLFGLKAIDHVEVVRVGTRAPVTLPHRLLDDDLLEVLEKAEKVWVNTHFNHPDEITELSKEAVKNLLKAGIPVNNQTVLLKGINDSADILEKLFRNLQKIKVRPYYLFHCDPVKGVMHFSTSITKGIKILEKLFKRISPFAIPYYAVDGPGGKGKVQILPDRYKKEGNFYIFRSFNGETFKMSDM